MQDFFSLVTHFGTTITAIISGMGYTGIFFLMVLESMVFPLPSELVMPFAGFLVARGEMSFVLVIIASAFGSLSGSLLSYYIGKLGGEPLIRKYGKYALVDAEDLEKTERWFRAKGEKAIFFSRMIPVVRHFISIPAGMAKMPLWRFCLYTLLGATLWNGFLAETGVQLGVHWDLVHTYLKPLSLIVLALLVLACGHFVWKHIKHKKNQKQKFPKSKELNH